MDRVSLTEVSMNECCLWIFINTPFSHQLDLLHIVTDYLEIYTVFFLICVFTKCNAVVV